MKFLNYESYNKKSMKFKSEERLMILEHVECIKLLHIHLDLYQNDRRGDRILTVVWDDVISNANILPKSIMWISD